MWEQPYRRVAEVAARQRGLITAGQAGRVDVGLAMLNHFRECGLVRELGWPVYQIAGTGLEERLATPYSAWLALAPESFGDERPGDPTEDAVLSHESACSLLGIGSVPLPVTRFTAAAERPVSPARPVPHYVRVTVGRLTRGEIMLHEGMPVTTPHRTILDLMAERTTLDTGSAAMPGIISDAVRRDLVDLRALFEDLMADTDMYGLLDGGVNFVDGFLPEVRPESLSPRNQRAYAELRFPETVAEIRTGVERLLGVLRRESGDPVEASRREDERLGPDLAAEIAARTAPQIARVDVNWEMDEIDSEDDLFTYRGEPFTGELVDHGMDRLRSQDFYTSGIVDGPTREWWSDGTPKAEGRYRRGRPVGDFRKWHENGRLAMVKHFDEGGFGDLIKIEEWDEDGNVVPRR
jgi:hypothetical protein